MSQLKHFVLRFVFPLSCAIGGIALLATAYLERADHTFAAVLFTICGGWLLFWAVATSTVAFVPPARETEHAKS